MPRKRAALLALLLALAPLLCACSRNPSEGELYQKLFDFLGERGFSCAFRDGDTVPDAAIYDASVWRVVDAGGESVYVYFDESNRADYLLSQIDQSVYGYATRFGLRFILNYRGQNEVLLQALQAMND